MRYLVLIEPTGTGYSAYAPDLLGCIATGATPEQVEANMREAMELHVEALRAEGRAIPEPRSSAAYVEVGT